MSRKAPDFIIQQRIKTDDRFADAIEYANYMKSSKNIADWHASISRPNFGGAMARESATIKDELKELNNEVKIRREAKLHVLFETEARQYEAELASMGLAVKRDRN